MPSGKLKPCPFCGNLTDLAFIDREKADPFCSQVVCVKCFAQGPNGLGEDKEDYKGARKEASKAWNEGYKVISDRYFAARENLAEIAEKSDNPLAREWHRTYIAVMGNSGLCFPIQCETQKKSLPYANAWKNLKRQKKRYSIF